MKTFMMALVATVSLGVGAASADPALGTWKTAVDDGLYAHIKMSKCGPNVCGVIARSFKGDEEFVSANNGKTLVIDMAPNGSGNYAGKVWRPSNDKIYVGKMTVSGNSLKLSGCVAGGLICSKQTWTRLN